MDKLPDSNEVVNQTVTIDTETPRKVKHEAINTTATAPPPKGRWGMGVFCAVLVVFLIAQAAFVGYAHWFLTTGLKNAVGNLNESSLFSDLNALTESSLEGLGSLNVTPGESPRIIGPDNNGQNVPSSPPDDLFLDPNADISVDELMDAIEALGDALGLDGNLQIDPHPAPHPEPHQQDPIGPPDDIQKLNVSLQHA